MGHTFKNIVFGAQIERIHLAGSFIPSLTHMYTLVTPLAVCAHTHTTHAFWLPPITLGLIKHPGGLFLNADY